jgi:hypothetical protein
MPREFSTTLQQIFAAYKRRDTLDIYLNDETVLHLSRGSVTRSIGETDVTYQNWIRSVDDLRGSIEASIDRITVTCQNVNSELGFDLASDMRLLDYALADYGKQYQSIRNPALIEDIPQVFRGVLANAETDEQNITFELIVDYESLGSIVASRALSPRCWWTYKGGTECHSTSEAEDCPQTRKACARRGVEHEFGGWEAFIEPTNSPPGGGGNDGGGIGTGTCFTLDTPVWTPEGALPIGELKVGQRIISFDPETGVIDCEDEITKVLDHEAAGFYTFEFEHGEINVTPEHRLFRANNIFVLADMFKIGDTVRANTGQWFDSRLKRIRWNSDQKVPVRNLHVRHNRTYFANRCGAHNAKPLEPIYY